MSVTLLVVILAAVVVLTIAAPLHYLLTFNLLLVALPPGEWHVGGILFDGSDLVYAFVALSLVFRGRPAGSVPRVPYLGLWFLLGMLFSISYVTSPVNSEYMTDPARIAYQLYRYAWRPILFYPLAALFLSTARPTRSTIYAVVAAGTLCAAQAIPEGYAGVRAGGPLGNANLLGAVLVVPIVLTYTLLIATKNSMQRRGLLAACLLVLIRGLLFSNSRGALAASMAGIGMASFFLFRVPSMRSAVVRFVLPVALAGLFFLMIPGTLDRPNIQRALSITEGQSADTFQWRVENRWLYFLDQAIDEPIFGTGRAVDLSLGDAGNTPHNGYIAVAVKRGFPALGVFLIFSFIAIRNGLRLVRDPRPNPWGPVVGVMCVSTISAFLIHNIVESNFEVDFTSKMFWTYVALAAVAGQAMKRAPVGRPIARQLGPRPLRSPLQARGEG